MGKKVVLIGTAGSGKSTLAGHLFCEMKVLGHNVELVDEVIRREIQRHGPMRSIWEQYRTRSMQKEAEDVVPAAVDWTICDSGTLTPYFYACLYADQSDARQRLVLQDMFRYLIDDLYLKRYDHVLVVPLLPGTDTNDGTRYQTQQSLQLIDRHMRMMFMEVFPMPNVALIDCPFDQRLQRALQIIGMQTGQENAA